MALQWTPLRPQTQTNVFSQARQSVAHLEHPTQSNVLLTFKLMVSGDGAPHSRTDTHTLLRSRSTRKMTDIGIQCDTAPDSPPEISTVAEINTSVTELVPNTPTRPVSVEFINSLGRERRRTICENIDEINLIQPVGLSSNEKQETEPQVVLVEGKTEVDGIKYDKDKEDSCCVDCIYVSLKCCECTIL